MNYKDIEIKLEEDLLSQFIVRFTEQTYYLCFKFYDLNHLTFLTNDQNEPVEFYDADSVIEEARKFGFYRITFENAHKILGDFYAI